MKTVLDQKQYCDWQGSRDRGQVLNPMGAARGNVETVLDQKQYCDWQGSRDSVQILNLTGAARGNVETVLDQKDERGVKAMLLEELDLAQVLDRDVEHLSGASPALFLGLGFMELGFELAWCHRCKPAPARPARLCAKRMTRDSVLCTLWRAAWAVEYQG